MAFITVSPKISLMDRIVNVKVTGLKRNAKVTLYSHTTLESGNSFYSIAQYLTGICGEIDLSRDNSFGGFYIGCESMGFLWSMKPYPDNKRPNARFVKENGEIPLVITLKIHKGFCDSISEIDSSECLAKERVVKVYMGPGVKRISIDDELKGSLFVPDGPGPFPGVISIFGGIPKLVESRAAMMASRGILAFALLFYGRKGLPKDYDIVDMNYFEKAVNFLRNHPQCDSRNGVGILGSSLGGQISAVAGWKLEGVNAVVIINSPNHSGISNFKHKDWFVPRVVFNSYKPTVFKCPFDAAAKEKIFPIHKNKNVKFLLQYTDADEILSAVDYAIQNNQLFDSVGHKNYKINIYHNAGHVLSVPHTPHFYKGFAPWANQELVFGGTARGTHHAQKKCWEDIINFIFVALAKNQSKL